MFHEWNIACPRCGKAMTPIKLSFDTDGGMLTEAVCIPCREHGNYCSDIFEIVGKCRISDKIDLVLAVGNELVN
jgi:hypothetical protein